MTIVHENTNPVKRGHIGHDFPDEELWDMFASLHQEMLRKVLAADNPDLERDFWVATSGYRDPVAFQFNRLYLFAEAHGLLSVHVDGTL